MKVSVPRKQLRRRLRELALSLFPKRFAHQWIRNSIDLSIAKSSSKIHFEIASNADDLKEALSLVQKTLEREGYASAARGSIRLTPYHLLPETIVIIGKLGNKIVATISVIPRTAFGVPLDGCVSLNTFVRDRGKVVEISSLAVDPVIRGEQGSVLYNLMKYMYHCNMSVLGANTEVIGVNPKMTPLYEAILLFKKIPNTQTVAYEFANRAPVVPMYFSLDTAARSYEKMYGDRPAHKNVMEFFLADLPSHFSLPTPEKLLELLPQRKPEELREILGWNRDLLRSLAPKQLVILEGLYASLPECASLFKEVFGAGRECS